MTGPSADWDYPGTGKAYARYCQSYTLYADASRDLVSLADLRQVRVAIDLGCGTGTTTRALLECVPVSARLYCVDSAEEMLAVARNGLPHDRIDFVRCSMDTLPAFPTSSADLIISSSAIHQANLKRLLVSVRRVLTPSGIFLFNLGDQFIVPDGMKGVKKPGDFLALVQQAAHTLHGYEVQTKAGGRSRLSMDQFAQLLSDNGLDLERYLVTRYWRSPESVRDFYKLPVILHSLFPTLNDAERTHIIDIAYSRWQEGNFPSIWTHFATRRLRS